jgi:hypothetical protein
MTLHEIQNGLHLYTQKQNKMKTINQLLLLVTVLFCSASLYSQTVDEIIAKHLDAVGGKEKLSGVTSVHMEGTVEVMGSSGTTKSTILTGKGSRSESELGGQQVVNVYTDKGGWQINQFAGMSDPQAMTDEQFKAGEDQIYFEPFLDYAARGAKAELVGQEKVGTVDAHKIKYTNKDGAVTTFYIDPTSFQVIQVSAVSNNMGQEIEVKSTYSDFQKTDYGIVLPHSIDIDFGGQFAVSSKIQKVDVNQPVDASIFEMKK